MRARVSEARGGPERTRVVPRVAFVRQPDAGVPYLARRHGGWRPSLGVPALPTTCRPTRTHLSICPACITVTRECAGESMNSSPIGDTDSASAATGLSRRGVLKVVAAGVLVEFGSGVPRSFAEAAGRGPAGGDEVSELAWWQRGVVYEIYPRSFKDANGDGIGDLRGIIDELDYLSWLGVDALWLTPVFPSPMVDFGYDVSDYTDIDPVFGDLAMMDALVREAHARRLKIVLDFVANHTSDRHPWFLESRSSRSNPKRDWYIWRDPAADGGPPNNWKSAFGGGAWEWDAATGQYYYHAFARQQPDLNWRNPDVREAMHAVLRFWLERGVDGFRLDAVARLIKDHRFRDNPTARHVLPARRPDLERTPYTRNLPEVHEVLAEFRRLVDG